MNFKLRSPGAPCPRSPRGTLAVVAGVVALATAPAAAAQEFKKPLGWYTDDAAVPASVEFEDVAANADAVVAVGSDADTGTPVVYSRRADVWGLDTLPATVPAAGELVDVALAASGLDGWAVGSAGGTAPLVLRLTAGTWEDESGVLPAGTNPTTVALAGATVVIGDAAGKIHRVADGGTTTSTAPGAGSINGLSLFGASSGFAVADHGMVAGNPPLDETVRIYDLGSVPVLDADERASTVGVDMTGLAAVSAEQAVAIDSTNRTWRVTQTLQGKDWVQDTSPAQNAQLAAVAAVKEGPAPFDEAGWQTEFLAGATGGDAPTGALWHRVRFKGRSEAWIADAVPAGTSVLTGVAATAWDAAWAVGPEGTVLRYWSPPDPKAEQAAREEAERLAREEQERLEAEEAARWQAEEEARLRAEAEEQARWQAEEDARLQAEEDAWRREEEERRLQEEEAERRRQEEERRNAPPAPPPPPERDNIDMNGVVVKQPQPEQPAEPAEPKAERLVKNVRAARRGRKLIVSFRLTSRARVQVAATRGRKVVAKTRMRTLSKGRRKLVLRFRGKPPSSLKLVARPAPASKAKDNKRKNRTRSRRES